MLLWLIKCYRTVALSDNMVVNYIANTMTLGQNVIIYKFGHIMSKYNVTHHELLHMPMNTTKYKCKDMWNINLNPMYFDYVNMICELVVMRDCNNGIRKNVML